MEPSTLDTLQAIQKDISLCDLSDPLGRSYALALIPRLESKMSRYNSVQEAMSRLANEPMDDLTELGNAPWSTITTETPEEKAILDALPQETIDAMDAQLVVECREYDAAAIFSPILDLVRPK